MALPRGVRAARDHIQDAQRRVQQMAGRVDAIAGGSATGVDRALEDAVGRARSELTHALQALHSLEQTDR